MLLSEVSGSSFLAREVVEAARGNRHFESGRWFDVASVVSALFTYKMNIFGGKYSIAVLMCCYSRRCQGAEVVVVVEVGAERFFSSRQQSSSSPPTWTGDLGAVKILLTSALLERGILRPFAIKNVLHAVRKYTLTRIHTQTTSIVCTISLWKLNVFNLQTSRAIPQTSSSVLYVKLQNHTRKTTSLANQTKHEI